MALYDYYVIAVQYNGDDTHIANLKVMEHDGAGKLKPAVEMTRPQVVGLIQSAKTFSTVLKNKEGKLVTGSPLGIFPVTIDYLKTQNDNSTRDNLESMPTF